MNTFHSFRGKFHRADVFTRTFLRIGKPALPGDSWAIYWFGFRSARSGGTPNGREVTTGARKFTIISTECTRTRVFTDAPMHRRASAQSPSAPRHLELSLFSSTALPPAPADGNSFPETFKLCYLFVEFLPDFFHSPSSESYSSAREGVLLLKVFPLPYPISRTFDYPGSFDRNSCH